MSNVAYLPIEADRYGACVRQIYIRGLDLTNVAMRAQVRLAGDTPGAPLVDLQTVTNGNAEGLRLVGIELVDGLPVSHVELVINETTMEALPYAGELGAATSLAWDWQLVLSGRKQRIAKGDFVITGDGVTGADNAPANRPAAWSRSFLPNAGMRTGATLTFGDETIEMTIDGADLVAAQVDRATSAQDRAEDAQRKADLSAGAAQAVARYFTTRAAGEAASAVDQAFATDDGSGNVIYYKRTAGGSTEIGRAATPAALDVVRQKAAQTVSVIDFGAVGDGVTDDANAIDAAIQSVQSVVNGIPVGGEVTFPFRPMGYVIGRKLFVYQGVQLRVLGRGQLIYKRFDGDMFEVSNGGGVSGGDWRGGGYRGHAFFFPNGQGKQRLDGVKADSGWVDEPIFYSLSGGSQSIINDCVLTAGAGKFAVKVEDGFANTAVPRKVSGLQTNGGLGIDFGGCNDFFVSDSFVGGLRFTDDSRGVHTVNLRVANQPTIDIRGHNLVLAGGWNPIPTFKSGADVLVWAAYCNSGRPIDETGNARNSITFAESTEKPVLRSDNTALTLTSYRTEWGVKRSGATYTYRLELACSCQGGVAAPSGLGFGSVWIDMPAGCFNYGAEQWVTGLFMTYQIGGVSRTKPILCRIQSIGGQNKMQLFDMDSNAITGSRAPGGVDTPSWILTNIFGQISYSPA